MRIQSKAEAARQMATAGTETGAVWHREADSWFDGSIESVDRRLAMCDLLLARSEERYARNMGAQHDLRAIIDLQASQRHLRGLREDLLTASTWKEAAPGLPGGPTPEFTNPDPPPNINESLKQPWRDDVSAGRNPLEAGSNVHGIINGSLGHADHRYVALEGASFYRAQDPDTSREEMLIRAQNHAELQTSTYPAARSQAITAAFVQKVAALAESDRGRYTRPQRVASAVTPGPDEWLFM